MAKLDFEWLKPFDALVETGSVSKAAERLGITQGSASTALNKLRTRFNDPLFMRTSKGMEPTPFARGLHPDLKHALVLLGDARRGPPSFEPATSDRAFRICISDYVEIELLPRLLNAVYPAAPRVQIKTEKITPESPRRLESGELDLAIGLMPHLEAGFLPAAIARPVVRLHRRKASSADSRRQADKEGVLRRASRVGAHQRVKEWSAFGWDGIFVPAATPSPVIEKLNHAITDALKDPEVVRAFTDRGLAPVPLTVDETADFMKKDLPRWVEATRRIDIKVE